jgi:hypothetical protein
LPSKVQSINHHLPACMLAAGSIIAGLADRLGAHRGLLITCYLGMTFIQGLMALPALASFTAMLALTVATSVVCTPASIIADAAVMAASTHVRLPPRTCWLLC